MLKVMREWSSARLLKSSRSADYAMKILPTLKMDLNDDENDGAHVVQVRSYKYDDQLDEVRTTEIFRVASAAPEAERSTRHTTGMAGLLQRDENLNQFCTNPFAQVVYVD